MLERSSGNRTHHRHSLDVVLFGQFLSRNTASGIDGSQLDDLRIGEFRLRVLLSRLVATVVLLETLGWILGDIQPTVEGHIEYCAKTR